MNIFFFIFSEDLTSLQADSQEEQAWLACPILDSQQHDKEFEGDRSLTSSSVIKNNENERFGTTLGALCSLFVVTQDQEGWDATKGNMALPVWWWSCSPGWLNGRGTSLQLLHCFRDVTCFSGC